MSEAAGADTVTDLKRKLRATLETVPHDHEAVLACCAALAEAKPAANMGDLGAQLEGNWRTLYSTLPFGRNAEASQGLPLPALTFGTLPGGVVSVSSWYNCIGNGRYALVPCVRGIEASEDSPVVGVVLEGPYTMDAAQCSVTFESARLVAPKDMLPQDSALPLSSDLIADAGKPRAIAKPVTAPIEVGFIDDELRVHTGRNGDTYVLERVDTVPLPL